MVLLPISLSSSADQIPTPTSDNATIQPNPHTSQPQGGGTNGEDADALDRKPDLQDPYARGPLDLAAPYTGNIFDEEVTIDNETIKASRCPCTRSYADPVQSFEDQSRLPSAATAEASSNLSNKKYSLKK